MTRQNPRRPGTSRNPVSRPRRIAGRPSEPVVEPVETAPQVVEPVETSPQVVEPVETSAADTKTPPPVVDLVKAPPPVVEPVETSAGDTETPPPPDYPEPIESSGRDLGNVFASRRTTVVLTTIAAVLALVAAGLGIWLWQHDPEPPTPPAKEGEIAVPAGRPVQISADDAQEAVAAAAESASTIVATSYKDYDDQVDEAAALMTDDFAKEYRQTAEDVKQDIIDTKTEVQVRIVAQGVVRANTSEVQALLFLNQYSSKNGGKTTYTPYRALVTVVHTDSGWLVSGLDTK